MSDYQHEGQLERTFKAVRKDLLREGGAQISTTRNYNFAIVPYAPEQEFACRAQVSRLSRPRLAFVVAASRNGVIGKEGKLPWRLSSDLKYFKTITMGKPLIMGRKTWESLPNKPLPGRTNIVLTRDGSFEAKGAGVCDNFSEAV